MNDASPRGARMSWLLYTALAASLLALVASRRCCPDAEVYLSNGRRCSVTAEHVALNCSKYLLNPTAKARDRFTVTDDDHLLHGSSDIEPDRYCVTRLMLTNNTLLDEDVALVCFPDQPPPRADDDKPNTAWHYTMIGVLLFVSVAFMVAMLLVYALLPDMRDLEGKCLMSAVLNLCVAFLLLAIMQFLANSFENQTCVAMAFSLYFWMMAAFFWLNVVSYNMWRSVVCTATPSSTLYLKYRAYGWGCPLLFLAVALLMELLPDHDFVRPRFGHKSCWFHDGSAIWWYFYGPIAVLITANAVLFVWTAVKLWRQQSTQSSQIHSLRFKCVLYVKLFIIMGITWMFEIISHAVDRHNALWTVTDVLNSLQGVLIFIVTVACRRRVLRGLAQQRTCGIPWPKSWAAGVDAESHVMLADADVEMPTQGEDKILS